jgi:hypothetical protein
MLNSFTAPRMRIDLLVCLGCEYFVCLLLALLISKELNFGTAALYFGGLYILRAANWLLNSGCSLLSFWLTRQQRINTLLDKLHYLDMPRYTDFIRYDEAPSLITGVAQRAEISEDLRNFLQALAGELFFLRSNRRALAYVQSLAILNGALSKYRQDLPVRRQQDDPVEERRSGRGLQVA